VTRRQRSAGDPLLVAALVCAYAAFAWTFRGPRHRFWNRMTITGLSLGTFALFAEGSVANERPRRGDAAPGAASAAGLYAIFLLGDAAASRIMPRGREEIDCVYSLRSLEPPAKIATRLALVIGPAEELFWRGFVQRRMSRRLGTTRGWMLASAAYGAAHIVAGNATLVGAATVAGSYWGALAAAGATMTSLIASHVFWDVGIFLLAPTRTVARD
jgi:membrane protease YdiL (CAAX protease family)